MRLLLSLFFGFLSFKSAAAQGQLDMSDIADFHNLVSTGGVAAVERALDENPALATASDKFGFQAIHVLDYTDFEKVLSVLVAHGADINAKNDEGSGLAHILIDPEFLPVIVRFGADLNLKDQEGRTPLMLHLQEPEGFDMVEELLRAGADPNARDQSGQSVLDYARTSEDSEVVELLLEAGASD